MKKQEKEAMRRNQRKAKTIKPLERISEVIGATGVELSKQRRGIGVVSEATGKPSKCKSERLRRSHIRSIACNICQRS